MPSHNLKKVNSVALSASFAGHESPEFARRHGFALKLERNNVSVLLHDDVADKDHAKRIKILKREGLIAHVQLDPVGYKWSVLAEPTDDGRVGLTVVTQKGKTIASGEAWLQADGSLEFTCQTLYPGIKNEMKYTWNVSGTCDKDGNCTVTASVGGEC